MASQAEETQARDPRAYVALPDDATPVERLSRAERAGVVALFALAILFGGLVEMRSAFLTHRRTDLDVYLRAAWAVRTGADIYAVTDDNQWHYHYPPLFAILMVPLADPPPGADRKGVIPFAVTVALWYALNLGFLALAANTLACALEQSSGRRSRKREPHGSRRWWLLRLIPVLACIPAVGETLERGEVNLLLLALLCAMAAAVIRGRSWRAGLWLSAAICLKVIPAFLLVYPLWRRDARFAVGCALGLVVGMGVIPAMVLGPSRTLGYYREWNRVLLEPALAGGSDQSRTAELIGVASTDSQSLQTIIHNTLYLDETIRLFRGDRPSHMTPAIRAAHWLLGGLMTALTLAAAGRRKSDSGLTELLLLGTLMVVMVLLSPVCHLHYFALSIPLMMGFVMVAWEGRGSATLGSGWSALMAANFFGNLLPLFPRLQVLKDLGLGMYAALMLWTAGTVVLWKRQRSLAAPSRPTAEGERLSGALAGRPT